MKHIYNKHFFVLLILICSVICAISASPYFSGFSGGSFDFNSSEDNLKPELNVAAFFAGQFDISKQFIFRMDLGIETENIIGTNFLAKTPSTFSLNEASFTYAGALGPVSHYITAFIGTPEPIGSPIFLQRHFSAPNFNSRILYTRGSYVQNRIYPISGIGADYIIKTKKTATGIYFYYNKNMLFTNKIPTTIITPNFGEDITSTGNESSQTSIVTTSSEDTSLNIDLRFAAAGSIVYADIGAGFSFPFDHTDDTGSKVILIIRKANFHFGFNFFLGSAEMSGILFQGGITKLEINPDEGEKIIALEDIYAFIEPRFVTPKVGFSFAMFNIPSEVAQSLFYIRNPLGVNVSVFSNNFSIKSNKAEIGAHFTVSLPKTKVYIDFMVLEFQIAPFFNLEIGSGKFDAAVRAKASGISSAKDFFMNMILTAGYKVSL